MKHTAEVVQSEEVIKALKRAEQIAYGNFQFVHNDLWVLQEDLVLALLTFDNPGRGILCKETGSENLIDGCIYWYTGELTYNQVVRHSELRQLVANAKDEARWSNQKTVFTEHLWLSILRMTGWEGSALRDFIVHHVGHEGFFRIRAKLMDSAKAREISLSVSS